MRTTPTLALIAALLIAGCSQAPRGAGLSHWVTSEAVPVRNIENSRDLRRVFDSARVVGLGEATHGQHESFETKRALTMHLIRSHGYRIVAYEASASKAAACDAYIAGESDDLDAAMRGFGMLIWKIEENAALLRDLREWNTHAPADQRVRFVGVDVQDATACAARLAPMLEKDAPADAAAVRSLAERLDGTVQKMFGGDRAPYDDLVRESIALIDRARASAPPNAVELRAALLEFEGSVQMYLTPGRRDHAMADMALNALDNAGRAAKIVLWAHNGHVTKSPLRYLGTEELAMGGHIARTLGEKYYAIGFAFGEGDFAANDVADGKWIFRTYGIDAPPDGSLESAFMTRVQEASIIDIRRDTKDAEVEQWKLAPHGQRWFGGYRVPEDAREISRDASKLLPTYPREAFDALVFLPKTTASTPRQ